MTRDSTFSFAASQAIEPIVPGMKRKRYDRRRGASASLAASSVRSTMPDRLSFASEGWQTCVVSKTSSSSSPVRRSSPYVNEPGLESAVHHDLERPVPEPAELALGKTEAPGARVIGGAIGDPLRIVRMRVQVRPELSHGHLRPYRLAVADDVEIRVVEVDDTPPVRAFDVSCVDVPLVRDDPVENLRAACHLVNLDRDPLADQPEGRPNAVAGDASAEREQFGRKRVHSRSSTVHRDGVHLDVAHDTAAFGSKSGYERSRSLITAMPSGHAIRKAGSS